MLFFVNPKVIKSSVPSHTDGRNPVISRFPQRSRCCSLICSIASSDGTDDFCRKWCRPMIDNLTNPKCTIILRSWDHTFIVFPLEKCNRADLEQARFWYSLCANHVSNVLQKTDSWSAINVLATLEVRAEESKIDRTIVASLFSCV